MGFLLNLKSAVGYYFRRQKNRAVTRLDLLQTFDDSVPNSSYVNGCSLYNFSLKRKHNEVTVRFSKSKVM